MPDGPSLIVGGKDGVYYHVNPTDMGKRDFTKLIEFAVRSSLRLPTGERTYVAIR